jgi:hypothetical protein
MGILPVPETIAPGETAVSLPGHTLNTPGDDHSGRTEFGELRHIEVPVDQTRRPSDSVTSSTDLGVVPAAEGM